MLGMIISKNSHHSFEEVKDQLGNGPVRFYYPNEISFAEQLASLSSEEKECYNGLKVRWKEMDPGYEFSDEMYLRFARNSPGKNKFNQDTAWKVMKKFDTRYLTLTAASIEDQLLTKTLFIPPNLHSKDGHDVFYMRPSRYFPKKTSTKLIIDNLAYCMQVMQEKEKSETEGIGFLANMNDWSMSNFSVDYCLQFMKMLQGRIPVRVRLFLIVNPPSWFSKIWAIMKPMLTKDFRKKVHVIKEDKLSDFLEPGYENFLPDELQCGTVSTDDIVSDFIKYRKFMETS